jgi:hypothetical protein
MRWRLPTGRYFTWIGELWALPAVALQIRIAPGAHVKNRKSDSFQDQQVIDNRQARLAVQRYYASAVDPTKIVDGFPKKRASAPVEVRLDAAA